MVRGADTLYLSVDGQGEGVGDAFVPFLVVEDSDGEVEGTGVGGNAGDGAGEGVEDEAVGKGTIVQWQAGVPAP